jgi:hypothetical protein
MGVQAKTQVHSMLHQERHRHLVMVQVLHQNFTPLQELRQVTQVAESQLIAFTLRRESHLRMVKVHRVSRQSIQTQELQVEVELAPQAIRHSTTTSVQHLEAVLQPLEMRQ